jgi:lipopolysaccharide biosynthesis glycosyltransferase
MKQTDGIVTLSDGKFFPGALALVKSIRCNSPISTTVLDTGLSELQRSQLLRLGAHVIKPQRTVDLDVTSRFGCCYAFFDIAQAPYENILYIDADCLVLQNLKSVFRRIEKHGVVAVNGAPARLLANAKFRPEVGGGFPRDAAGEIEPAFRHVRADYPVLNTGVVGIKRSLMERVVAETAKYAPFFGRFRYPDQDLFNIILAELHIDWHNLGYLYNATSLNNDLERTAERKKSLFQQLERNLDLEISNQEILIRRNRAKRGASVSGKRVAIVHYTSGEKPWLRPDVLRPGMYELWQTYHDLSLAGMFWHRWRRMVSRWRQRLLRAQRWIQLRPRLTDSSSR